MRDILSLLIFVCFTHFVHASYGKEHVALFHEEELPNSTAVYSVTNPIVHVYFERVLYSPDQGGNVVPQRLSFPPHAEIIEIKEDGVISLPSIFSPALQKHIQQKLNGLDVEEPSSKLCSLPTQHSDDPNIYVEFPLFTRPSIIISKILSAQEGMRRFSSHE